MSMTDCAGCGKAMMKNTATCPHCQTANAAASTAFVWGRKIIAVVFSVIVGGWLVVQCSKVVVDLGS